MNFANPYYAIPNSDPCVVSGGTRIFWDGSHTLSSSNMPGNFGAGRAILRGSVSLPLTPEFGPYLDEILEPLRAVEGFDELWSAGSEVELDEAIERGLARRKPT